MSEDGRTVTTFSSSGEEGHRPRAGQLLAEIGRTIADRYKVERVLGEGGMGVVYLARDLKFDKKRVALKVLKDERVMLERFFDEAQAASSIGSPHIVSVLDYGTSPSEGCAYIVMELLDGRSLASVLDETRILSEDRILHVARQMAAGLSAAHSAGIVHRDLKPDNVHLLSTAGVSDFVKILDFGIAKFSNRSTKLTQTGSVFGTPHYMSPEQSAGLPVDGRGDVYALGVMMYEMACGKLPFDAENPSAILSQQLYKRPVPPSEIAPSPHRVSQGIEAIILKCLTKKPAGRYESMDSLSADLLRLERGAAPHAVTELRGRSTQYDAPVDYFADDADERFAPRRKRGLLGGLIVGALAVGFVAVGGLVGTRRATNPAHEMPSVTVSTAAPSLVSAKRTIGLAVSPLDAMVTSPEGALPSVGGIVTYTPKPYPEVLVIARAGYASKSIEVGATSADLVRVDLVAIHGVPKGITARPPQASGAGSHGPRTLRRSDCFVDGKLAPFPECRAFATP